jgi:hypothetical protein
MASTIIRRTSDAVRRKREERRAANRAYDQMFVDAAIAERNGTQQATSAPAQPSAQPSQQHQAKHGKR